MFTPPARVAWRGREEHGWLTYGALAGILGALALATFGLPPVDIHSPLHYTGIMDPLCGMTRATRALAMGDLGTALRYNPASPLLPLGAALVLVRAAIGWRTGRWLSVAIRWRFTSIVIGLLLLGLLWWNQQANAELLMRFGMP
jgi:hypothetical protein